MAFFKDWRCTLPESGLKWTNHLKGTVRLLCFSQKERSRLSSASCSTWSSYAGLWRAVWEVLMWHSPVYECCLAVCALQQVTGQMHRLEFVYSQTADFLLGVRLVRVMILRRKKRLWRLRTGIATKQEMSEGLRDILYTWASCQTKDLFFFNKKKSNFFNPVHVYMVLPVYNCPFYRSFCRIYVWRDSKQLHSYS